VYPDGVWYGGLTVDDADAIANHLVDGIIYEPKRLDPPAD
jgi:(2Fe-2S) ferredoxin